MTATSPQVSPSEARRSRQREETRQQILTAGEALLVENGDDAFSIRALAERSGYTAPTIYHHFGDKDGLIEALVEMRFADLADEVEKASTAADPLDRQRAVSRAWLEFARSNQALYRLLFSRVRDGRDALPSPSVERARLLMSAPMDELARTGRLQVSDPDAARAALFCLTHGLTSLGALRPEFELSPEVLDEIIDAMLRGLSRPPTEAPSSPSRRAPEDSR